MSDEPNIKPHAAADIQKHLQSLEPVRTREEAEQIAAEKAVEESA